MTRITPETEAREQRYLWTALVLGLAALLAAAACTEPVSTRRAPRAGCHACDVNDAVRAQCKGEPFAVETCRVRVTASFR